VVYDRVTGSVAAVDPNVNGTVDTIVFSADCTTAYIGGVFTSVGGVAVQNIAKIDTTTGVVDPAFAHQAAGEVSALVYENGHLLAGGRFAAINGSAGTTSSYLASLDPVTGKPDSYAANLGIAGTLTGFWAPADGTRVFKMWLNPAGNRLAIDGVFTSVLGQHRRQAAVLDLGPAGVTLDPWYSRAFDESCSYPFYARSMAWSPDGQFLYVASTGVAPGELCDAVVKFSSAPSSTQSALWWNKTGWDSLYSVVATDTVVYVGGHMRWLDNPNGTNSCGPGCVSRPGIGEVDAATGLATTWNPTRSRGYGATDLFLDSAGDLWISSDAPSGSTCGGAFHPGICEFPHL